MLKNIELNIRKSGKKNKFLFFFLIITHLKIQDELSFLDFNSFHCGTENPGLGLDTVWGFNKRLHFLNDLYSLYNHLTRGDKVIP